MRDSISWNEIHGDRSLPGRQLPATPKLETPRVSNPKCPDHCSGKHEVDGFIQCSEHKVPIYRVVLHEYPWQEGHYWTSLAPMNGALDVKAGVRDTCPDCNRRLQRQWKR